MTIIPYFDPILGKLRNSDIALISTATLIVTDPLVVNNLIVNSNATITTLKTTNFVNTSTISTNLINTSRIITSTATISTAHISNIDWNLTSGATVIAEGSMNWDSNHGYLAYGLAGGNVETAVGMANQFPRRVKNSTGSTLPKGTAVYINGVSGNTPTVARAIATGDATSAFTLGLMAEDVANNNTGWVTTFGVINGIDLSSYTVGTIYLSGATAGAFTRTPQYAPNHYVRLGTIVRATADGELVVNVINGFETNELHDVVLSSLASGNILLSNGSLWYNHSLTSVLPQSANALASLTDVAFVSLATGNYLKYNGVKWTNDDVFINIDGGSSISNYLITQSIDGGNA